MYFRSQKLASYIFEKKKTTENCLVFTLSKVGAQLYFDSAVFWSYNTVERHHLRFTVL